MTRSVEIPEEARAAGLQALLDDPKWHKPDGGGQWRANYKRAVELVLEAALPYLAPAAGHTYGDGTHYPPTGGAHVTERCGPNCPPAPAGDGGLREAQLRQEFRAEIMRGYQAALCNGGMPDTGWTLGDEVAKVADNLLASLTAHPAAPAVPQPVDREAGEKS